MMRMVGVMVVLGGLWKCQGQTITFEEVLAQHPPPAGIRIAYGPGASQFGELRMPAGAGPHPVVVLLHGGCWSAQFDWLYLRPLAHALTEAGVATWTVEYRRVGEPGGGWPGTFQDVGAAVDQVRTMARSRPLDARRVVLVGHSAGGHLALWAAGRGRLPAESVVRGTEPLAVSGVVGLAPIPDLAAYAERGPRSCAGNVGRLVEEAGAERFRHTSPREMLPLGVPQTLVYGAKDPIVPHGLFRGYEQAAKAAGDRMQVVELEGAGHFDLVVPASGVGSEVRRVVLEAATRGR